MNLNAVDYEICILAGGLSRRMGQDKARLRVGDRTMLDHIRSQARATGLPVRVIRHDAVPRCGPLGGIYTALTTTNADWVVFLPCDMPFVSTELIRFILTQAQQSKRDSQQKDTHCSGESSFLYRGQLAGFPFLLSKKALPIVSRQIEKGQLSLQNLAKKLRAKRLRLPRTLASQLRNLNTPAELAQARRLWDNRAERGCFRATGTSRSTPIRAKSKIAFVPRSNEPPLVSRF